MKKHPIRVTAPAAMFAIIACVKTAESRTIAFNGSNMPMLSQALAMPALDVCALMSPAEATELAGIPIDRAERTSNGCNWYAKPRAAQQKGTDTAKDGFEKMSKQEPASFDEAMKNMEKLL